MRAGSLVLAARRRAYPALAALIGLCSCDLAPDYAPPQYVLPADYKGSAPFTIARPRDTLPRGPWWEGFGDALLNQLEQQLAADNPQQTQRLESLHSLFQQWDDNKYLDLSKSIKFTLVRFY